MLFRSYSGELTEAFQPICCELVSLADTSPRVTKLDLFDNNLEGTIPHELVSCSPARGPFVSPREQIECCARLGASRVAARAAAALRPG